MRGLALQLHRDKECSAPTSERPELSSFLVQARQFYPLTPETKAVRATETLRRAAGRGDDIRVTVVPVIAGGIEQPDTADVNHVLKCDRHSQTVV